MAAIPAVGDGGGDLISGLNDDLLVRILDLLPDTRDAVRTDALSRRWRGLWTGVAAVRFDSDYCAPAEVCSAAGAAERYLAFVNGALALRAASRRRHAVKDLAICFDISGHRTQELGPPAFFHAAQGWIRYAVQNQVESLILELDVPWNYYTKRPVTMAIDELATSAKLETMHLKLGYAQLGLSSSSSTVLVFASLTDLSLEDITVAGGDLLSRLVSSPSPCCPRLRKLRLSDLRSCAMDRELLLLESHTLLELSMEMMDMVQSLQLRTPSLDVLRVDLDRFKVSSSEADLLPSVATLKINLSSHGGFHNNDGSFDLLKYCRSTRSLEVSLDVEETKHRKGDIIKGRIPPLPHVTSLTLDVTLREPHFFGSGIGSFLAQCSSIRYLRLQLCYCIMKKDLLEQNLLCENDSCQWKSHDDFSLAHLQEIEFDKLIGTNCELQFIQSILKRGTGVQKIQISFDPYYWIKDNKDSFKLVPSLDGGSWTTCNDDNLSYKWRRYCV